MLILEYVILFFFNQELMRDFLMIVFRQPTSSAFFLNKPNNQFAINKQSLHFNGANHVTTKQLPVPSTKMPRFKTPVSKAVIHVIQHHFTFPEGCGSRLRMFEGQQKLKCPKLYGDRNGVFLVTMVTSGVPYGDPDPRGLIKI